jgi:hypothetical protein
MRSTVICLISSTPAWAEPSNKNFTQKLPWKRQNMKYESTNFSPVETEDMRITLHRKLTCGMTQNKMVQLGTGRHEEKTKELARSQKGKIAGTKKRF